jgi:uncharacterized protein YxeA
MRKYLIVIMVVALIVLTSVFTIQSRIEAKNNVQQTKEIQSSETIETSESNSTDQFTIDVSNVQQITGWDKEISTYFVQEANANGVLIYEEALPIASVETGGTYSFDAIHINTNGTQDGGLFQLNTVTYQGIVNWFKSEGRQFDSWDRCDPEFNISAGIFWIGHLKFVYNLEGHSLFTNYNKGVKGASDYYAKTGTYESDYSKKCLVVVNELTKYKNNNLQTN